jgi:hypothetical protein
VTYIATVDGELVDPYVGQVLMRLDPSIRDPLFPTVPDHTIKGWP